MPGNILNADTGFPTFAEGEDSNAKIDKVMNYLYMLLEQLRYSLNNLDADNFNEAGLKEIADGIARPLQTSFENEFGKTNALIEGWSNEYGSQIKLLTEWVGTDEDGNLLSSAASITSAVFQNTAEILALAKVVDEDSEALAGFKSEVSSTYATTQQFSEFKSEVDSKITDSYAGFVTQADAKYAKTEQFSEFKSEVDSKITNSYAGFVTQADAKYAKTTQIASVTDKDGNVTFASIAAGVADDEPFIELIADKVALKGFVTFESLENDGEGAATVNGNNLALVANASCDAISQLNFKKWRYTDYDYNTKDNQLENMAAIKAIDDERSALDDSRYAILIQTYDVHFNNTPYDIALKLIAQGAFSVETNYSAYIAAAEYCTIDALWNTRIRADRNYDDAKNAAAVASNDYSFNTDGIYYGGKRIVNNSKEV